MKYEVNETSPRHKEAVHIINVISKILGYNVKKLTGRSRQRHLVDARRICYVLLKEKMQLPSIIIGSYFDRDHASILYHTSSHEHLYKTYFDYRIQYDKAKKVVENNEYVEKDMYECINNMLTRIEILEQKLISHEKKTQ